VFVAGLLLGEEGLKTIARLPAVGQLFLLQQNQLEDLPYSRQQLIYLVLVGVHGLAHVLAQPNIL
jgi:hypothetical protein